LTTSLTYGTLAKVNNEIMHFSLRLSNNIIFISDCNFFPLYIDFHNAFLFFMPEIQKALTKLSKEKGCEVIARWKQACVRHFYWSVTSTTPKLGDVILAKFKAFLYHIINQHKDLPNQLFNKCAHDLIITARVFF